MRPPPQPLAPRARRMALAALGLSGATGGMPRVGHAQPAPAPATAGTLDALTRARAGRLAHYSSHDPRRGNADFRRLAPGDTITLLDHRGAGVVRRWWLTAAPLRDPALNRQLIVRAYWDDEPTPSVEVPLTDFFGMSFGEWRDFVSAPLSMTSGGSNSYWAMPFRRRARITVENRSRVALDRLYWNLAVEAAERLPDDVLYFHAQFRRVTTQRDVPVTVLEAEGRGHYVGTLLGMQPRHGRSLWYLEGNERVFVDADTAPSVLGTGTEDYLSSGWYFDTGPYSAPYHGAPIKDTASARIGAYRWHIEDPIPFARRLRFTIEHGGTNDTPGTDYATVAYWYQTHPHAPFPPLPAELLPAEPWRARRIPGVIEGEALVGAARATAGKVQVQDMGVFESGTRTWSDAAQLWWVEGRPGARLTIPLRVDTAGTYTLVGRFTRAQDYGVVRVSVNGTALPNTFDGYGPTVEPSGPVALGAARFRAGVNAITLELVGKNPRAQGYSDGYLVGLDGFLLRR